MADKQLVVADDMVVGLDYDLYLNDGELVDTTEGDSPILFIQGRGHVITGLEAPLYGMAVGATKEVSIAPEDGYGAYDAENVEWVPRSIFAEEMEIEIGLEVEVVDAEEDEILEAYIAEIDGEQILLDFNHPLAGETLKFVLTIASLRPATREELDHDHVHGEGGYDHDDDEHEQFHANHS